MSDVWRRIVMSKSSQPRYLLHSTGKKSEVVTQKHISVYLNISPHELNPGFGEVLQPVLPFLTLNLLIYRGLGCHVIALTWFPGARFIPSMASWILRQWDLTDEKSTRKATGCGRDGKGDETQSAKLFNFKNGRWWRLLRSSEETSTLIGRGERRVTL